MDSPLFVQYLFLALDASWRRLPAKERECATTELRSVIENQEGITTYAYTTTGLKAGTDLLLWRTGYRLDDIQSATNLLLKTRLGAYLSVPYSYVGLVRPSTYVRRQAPQEQAALEKDRGRYLVIYPFTKTSDWYLLSKATRQGMMNEHIKIRPRLPGDSAGVGAFVWPRRSRVCRCLRDGGLAGVPDAGYGPSVDGRTALHAARHSGLYGRSQALAGSA